MGFRSFTFHPTSSFHSSHVDRVFIILANIYYTASQSATVEHSWFIIHSSRDHSNFYFKLLNLSNLGAMRSHSLLVAFAFSAGLFDIAFGQANGRLWTKQSLSSRQDNNNQDNGNQDNNNQDNNKQGGNNQGGNNQGGGNNQATCLNPNVIQNASADDGQSQNDKGVKAGQAKSDT